MASDLFLFDDFHFPFSPFPDSPIDFLQDSIFENPEDDTKFENLAISHKPICQNDVVCETRLPDFSNLEVKTEDLRNCDHSVLGYQSFAPHSYGGAENVERFMQRSYSSNCFNENRGSRFRPNFDSVYENQNFETGFGSGQMRRVCSAGDLQQVTKSQGTSQGSWQGVASSFSEESNFKVGRYSAEERKERIHRYRAKRNLRNFNKTIKYACRKTLADNRPRVRGRFARNDETVETPKTPNFSMFDEGDERWVKGYNEDERTVRGGTMFNVFGPAQFQYFGFS